jgi:hypothetical protein
MKIRKWVWYMLLLLALVPVNAFAEEEGETALCSGTYFPILTYTKQKKQVEVPLKVTLISENGQTDEKKQVGIDGRDFEYEKKVNLRGLDKEKLAEMAEVRFWSLEDGKTLAIDEFKIETLDNVESQITFYNFEKNVKKSVRAYKSGDEIHGNKKYSQVKLQKYKNIKGDVKERPWSIEHRTMLTYIIFFLTVSPVILVIALIIFVYIQTEQLDKIARKKKIKRQLLWLLFPALFSFSGEASAIDVELHAITLIQEKAEVLAKEEALDNYLIEKSGIKKQLSSKEAATAKVDSKELTDQLNQPREQVVQVYYSRSLKVGDYENHIVPAIVLYSAVIALPFIYFFNRWIKTNQ